MTDWDTRYLTRGPGAWYPDERLIRWVMTHPMTSKVALDLGCGNGRHLEFLAEHGFDVFGIESSDVAYEMSRARIFQTLHGQWPSVKVRKASFPPIPWEDATFDIVVDICTIQHIPSYLHKDTFQDVSRVLKPGGVYFGVLSARETTYLDDVTDVPPRLFARRDVLKLLKDFRIESFEQTWRSIGDRWIRHWVVAAKKPED